ncbi:hypothetical protein Ahy_A09g043073 [Arachis hypogaea]|uniref:Uncharacterized protein n=1 Tax=Arachis hypogaea TaxID=3818 RepID=A0A445BHF8_ARAHY|nr:hypothetical protein Ahy_A09g043073 [Arachis hypogaea]
MLKSSPTLEKINKKTLKFPSKNTETKEERLFKKLSLYFKFDWAVYVMKWLEIIEPKNIKKGKYDWENWTQAEVDHFRVEYALRILFDEMNQLRDRAIKKGKQSDCPSHLQHC